MKVYLVTYRDDDYIIDNETKLFKDKKEAQKYAKKQRTECAESWGRPSKEFKELFPIIEMELIE